MKYLKAIFAAVFAGIGAAQTAYVAGHGHIGLYAGLTIAGGILTSLAVVWGIPNTGGTPGGTPGA